jgi:hypothetical protein
LLELEPSDTLPDVATSPRERIVELAEPPWPRELEFKFERPRETESLFDIAC